MATSTDTILTYTAIDLTPFEDRGVRYGINNARTTGPVHVDGTYYPSSSAIAGSAVFATDGSFAGDFTAYWWPSFTAFSAKAGDTLIADSTTYTVKGASDATTLELDKIPERDGTFQFSMTLRQREYLIEPDSGNNTFTGFASFQAGSDLVAGLSTNWGPSDVTATDFFKSDVYQKFYEVKEIIGPTLLRLKTGYGGDTTTTSYMAKKARIGREEIKYVKDVFSYDSQKARWTYDATTGSDISTVLTPSFGDLADGVTLSFTSTVDKNAPDLMEKAMVVNKTFAKETQFDCFQFPLPAVPSPEVSLQVFINNIAKDRYPDGAHDYIVSYSPNPIWEPSPPPEQRKIANLMFLKGIRNRALDVADTEDGIIQLIGPDGNNVQGILPGSDTVWFDGTRQTWGPDFVMEYNSGVGAAVDYTIGEPLVKYVAADRSYILDMGFSVSMDGTAKKCSFPPATDDDILFQPRSGRYKPAKQDRPSPSEEYLFNYMVEGEAIRNEVPVVSEGSSMFRVAKWPIKRDSILLQRTSVSDASAGKMPLVLLPEQNFHACYMSGTVRLDSTAKAGDVFVLSYVPLSEQRSGMSSIDGTSFCTSYGSLDLPLKIEYNAAFRFTVQDPNIPVDASSTAFLRIYNATRDGTYSLSGAQYTANSVTLLDDSTNTTLGLSPTDLVYADIRYASDNLEFKPVVVNFFVAPGDSDLLFIEGMDATSLFPVGAIVGLQQPDAATKYLFYVDSASYDNPDTAVRFKTPIPEDMTNPVLTISDDPLTFLTVPFPAEPFMSGSTRMVFKGENIARLFRRDTVLRLGDDLYSVAGASYDRATGSNLVDLTSKAVRDVLTQSTILYSDQPLYAEGETDVNPVEPIVTVPPIPGMILNYKGLDTLSFSVDSSGLVLGDFSCSFLTSPTLGEVSSAVSAFPYPVQAWTWTPGWPSRKLTPTDGTQYLYLDSSSVLTINPELRIDGTDSTAWTVSVNSGVTLLSGLVPGERIDFDYAGRRFLGDSTASYSLDYFTTLPKKSKVSASFMFDNLDQFYVQVLDRRDFFEAVSIPRLKEEAQQLNGNVGQGGEVAGDENEGNSAGGLADNEYRRKDAEIECRVFKDIYDFFSDRVWAYGEEYLAAEGLRMFNNDGMFTDDQQAQATKSYNRIFNRTDYTGMPPLRANPLTGEFTAGGAVFTKNYTGVSCIGDSTWGAVLRSGDFIGRRTTSKRYKITQVVSDSSVCLEVPFAEATTPGVRGEAYVASGVYPMYDDDGNIGPKISGNKSDNFGLSLAAYQPTPTTVLYYDTFDLLIDGQPHSYTFQQPVPAPGLMYPFELAVSLMSSPPYQSASQLASTLSAAIPGIRVTAETTLVPDSAYGFGTALVIRGDGTTNTLRMGSSSGVSKLGFTPDAYSMGNKDRTANAPETWLDKQEYLHMVGVLPGYIQSELGDLNDIITAGYPNKLNRVTPFGPTFLWVNDASAHIGAEWRLTIDELNRLSREISATGAIMQEPLIVPSFGDATYANAEANSFYGTTSDASAYDGTITIDWAGKGSSWKWMLDFDQTRQLILAKDSSDVGTDVTSGTVSINGQTTFLLEVPADHDRRILDATVMFFPYGPRITSVADGSDITGVWSMWDPIPDYSYSQTNQIRFTLGENYPLFYIEKDSTTPNPLYKTDSSAMKLYWSEDEGPVGHEFLYSAHPTVGDLTSAIDSVAGFGITSVHSGEYDYTNLAPITMPVGSGVWVYAGSDSPVITVRHPTYYNADSSKLIAGDTTFAFVAYPTQGDVSSAMTPGYSVVDKIADNFPSGPLIVGSGSVSPTIPGTLLRFLGDVSVLGIRFDSTSLQYSAKTYQTTGTSLILSWLDGTTPMSVTKAYASYPTIGALGAAVAAEPLWDATLFYDASAYVYEPLKLAGPSTVSAVGYTPVSLATNPAAMRLTAPDPVFYADTTAVSFIVPGFGKYENLYWMYPSVGALRSTIGSVPGIISSSDYDESYVYGYLDTTSGPVAQTGSTFHFSMANPGKLFQMFFDMSNIRYMVDATSLNILWEEQGDTTSRYLPYADNTSILSMKNAVNAIPGLDATGDPAYDGRSSVAFLLTGDATAINPDATVYPGLRPAYVNYETISEKQLQDRTDFLHLRYPELEDRWIYLDQTRGPQVYRDLANEELLRTADGGTGDLWAWANNRFNRRAGSEARLSAAEKLIETNQSALAVSQGITG